MKTIAVILARGGSKGIPNKNIVKIDNKPLIGYTISAAKKSKVSEVWVSTDCQKIKQISLDLGAQVLDRPKEYAQDFSKSEDALIHFSHNIDFDILVFIQPTSPLLLSDDINRGLDMMYDTEKKYDSIFTAYKEHWIPRWNLDVTPSDWNINNRPMRQAVKEKYVENGAFYISTKQALIKSKLRYSGKIGIVEMPLSRSFQIDNLDDLSIIKGLLND